MLVAGLIVLGFALGIFTAFVICLFAIYRTVRGPRFKVLRRTCR